MGAGTSTDTTAGGSVITLPQGGGAISGLGEKFSPDMFTGSGNFSVPIQVPAGRHGMQPQLNLGYSTGNGNGPFGLGWALSVPGVSRKTSHGLPRYRDLPDPADPVGSPADVFILSGAEDLVPVATPDPGRVRYRPRTEGLFARVEHVAGEGGDYWEVRARDGLTSEYGTPRPAGVDGSWRDGAVVADLDRPDRVFGWRITQTRDLLGNQVRYEYLADSGEAPPHRWNHPLLQRISYADYADRETPSFLVTVEFEYETRPDPFSDYRAGFEVRTRRRCTAIRVSTHAADGVIRTAREYRLAYQQAPFNGASLLARIDVVGIDEHPAPGQPGEQALPPLTFDYSGFDPRGRRFERVTGAGLPTGALSDPTLTLVDLHGFGLPDILELGPQAHRFWRNLGGGRFDLSRTMDQAPPVSLADPGVQVLDADGDGRADLMVSGVGAGSAGYFPMVFPAGWSRRSFQPYRQAPTVGPGDPATRLVDLSGDGLTDVLHSGSRLMAFFNDRDPDRAWSAVVASNGTGPQIDLSDPRIQTADMTGDGLQDLVLLRSGNVVYWPNLGYGRWGTPVAMRDAPRLPDGFNPRRVLLGDVDGDGLADLIYIADGRTLVWGNRSGNEFTAEPVTIYGTPGVADADAVQLADLHGTGMAGLLYTRAAGTSGASGWRFLDFTGGTKPYLLTGMDNHLGAATTVTYTPSTSEYLRDHVAPATRWRTTLPFPVHVVSRVEIRDAHSGGRLVTRYRYHHGYWDGVEREFRGFACVEQLDAETFDPGVVDPGDGPVEHHSPPTLTRTWFHPGPVAAAAAGEWTELDLTAEYWLEDPSMLARPASVTVLLAGLDRSARRDALRALRGHALRSELYALDGTTVADRPYTVTESVYEVRQETGWPGLLPGQLVPAVQPIFFPFPAGSRTTQWERGTEPMTRLTAPAGFDAYGLPLGQVDIAVPRFRDPKVAADPGAVVEPYLATYATTEYARRDEPAIYLVDRASRATAHEVVNDGRLRTSELTDAVRRGSAGAGIALRVIGQEHIFYDGDAFTGLPLGLLGDHGLVTRTETLAFADAFLDNLYGADDPHAISPRPPYLTPGPVTWPEEYRSEFQALLPQLAGYTHHTAADVAGSEAGYWIQTARHRYDVHPDPEHPQRVPRGLELESLDPFGAPTRIDYDEHDLLPVTVTDPVALTITAVHDMRVLQPQRVIDINGNTNAVTYTPLGLVREHFVRGKDGAGQGDQALPGTALKYDLLAFAEGRGPVSVTTARRVHHDTDLPPDELDETIRSVQFSDGFGRILQTRAQAEDVLFGDPHFGGRVIPADQSVPVTETTGRLRQPGDQDNVVASGWQTYDNKGRVVQKYEPFYSTGYDYAPPEDVQFGQKAVMFYDPRGQLIRTLSPDGSQALVVIGIPSALDRPDRFRPTPWETFTYDANDNAGRTHPVESTRYSDHWNTPASIEVDALGRTVTAIARNGTTDADRIITRTTYDIQGNITTITDAMNRTAFGYRFDLLKRRWRMDNIDAGRRDTVMDALGSPIESRDSKGAVTLGAFDRLHRLTRTWARDDATSAVTLRQRIDHGDGGDPGQPPADRDAAHATNLLGRPTRHHDEAGLLTTDLVDFKGNTLQVTRRVIADAPILATYDQARVNNWQVVPFRVDWTPATGQTQDQRDSVLLDAGGYVTTTSYDALNRVTRHVFPTDVEGKRRELHPTYNRAGALDQVRLDDVVYVERIAYDAKGQRTLIAYGNGVMTRYTHDPQTIRLRRLRSERYAKVDAVTYHATGEALQDFGYEYDLVGNIIQIADRTPGSGIPNNQDAFNGSDPALGQLLISGDALNRRFDYDPMYRLLAATGREHDRPPDPPPWEDRPRGTDVTRARAYIETYTYDSAGNVLRLEHRDEPGGFTRVFIVSPGSNRLHTMTIGSDTYDYSFDANGNLRSETTSRHFDWGHADELKAFRTQTDGAEPSAHAHYLYDAAGQRVKKLVRKQGGQIEVTEYIVGVFEHHRWGPASQAGQNNHLHLLDDTQRVAIVRIGDALSQDTGPAIQYYFGDHLGSSNVVVDQDGALTNREEFTPYGETSFGSFARKRYRFTGKERDEESGLSYHSARYLLCWTARWATVDPLCHRFPHRSPYEYAASSPNRLIDCSGRSPTPLSSAQHEFVDAVEQFVGNALRYARDNLGGLRSVERAIPPAIQLDAEAQMLGLDRGLTADRVADLRARYTEGLGLHREYRALRGGVRRAFPSGGLEPNFRQVPYRELLTSRLQLGRESLLYGTGGRGGGGSAGGGGAGGGGAGGGGASGGGASGGGASGGRGARGSTSEPEPLASEKLMGGLVSIAIVTILSIVVNDRPPTPLELASAVYAPLGLATAKNHDDTVMPIMLWFGGPSAMKGLLSVPLAPQIGIMAAGLGYGVPQAAGRGIMGHMLGAKGIENLACLYPGLHCGRR